MLSLHRNSLRFKIFSGFVFIFLSVILFGIIVATSLGRVVVHFEQVLRVTHDQIEPLISQQTRLLLAAMPVNDFLITRQSNERIIFNRARAEIDKNFDILKANTNGSETKQLLRESEQLWRSANELGLKILKTSANLGDPSSSKRMKRFDRFIGQAVVKINRAEKLTSKQVEVLQDKAYSERRIANYLILVIWILTPTVSIIAALWLSRIILIPINTLQQGARKIGRGDLDQKLDIKTGDEFEALAREFHVMAHRLKKNRDMLHTLAIHDGLTGLFNHREFHRLLRQEIERSKRSLDPLALLFIDIDHFKNHNDSYGHKQGDKALKIIARLIKSQIRQIDMSARYGGEEFAVILPGAGLEEATSIAERMRVAINTEPFIVADQIIQISVSIGIAEYPADASDANNLIEAADLALYTAKKGGRDRVCQRSS